MLTGKLYLIPSSLAEESVYKPDLHTLSIIHSLRWFLAERAKTARHFIKSTNPPFSQSDITVMEIPKHGQDDTIYNFLCKIKQGSDGGFLSEAGCPGVADPGAEIVSLAHEMGIKVVPLVGPSSILLALMSSGMNGQSFCFNGYLPHDKSLLAQTLLKLEADSVKFGKAHIWIETPYRNNTMREICLATLSPETRFCIAAELTSVNEKIFSGKIKTWKLTTLGDLHKMPAIFLMQA
jgi:16S rRNA (cytidine1402-2'-O)-methyltransferase